jgi:hypothetical protein
VTSCAAPSKSSFAASSVELVREQLNGAAPVVAEAPQSRNGATPSTKNLPVLRDREAR